MTLISTLYTWQYVLRQQYSNRKYKRHRANRTSSQLVISCPKKVLIVCAGLIGDSVMSSPVIMRAREIWQDAEITLLGQKHNCDLFAACQAIDKFYETPVIPFSLRKRKEEESLSAWLAAQKFDIALVLLGGQFGEILAKADIPVRVCGKLHTRLPNYFTHLYDGATPRTWGANDQLNSLRCLGFEVDPIPSRLWVLEGARHSARIKVEKLGLESGKRYVVIHPFGSTQRQWWPLRNVENLVRDLNTELGLPTVLIGGNDTRRFISRSVSEATINTAGQLTLQELMSVIDESTLVISTDSGPFHIAGAFRIPLIGLFRARRPEHAKRYQHANVILGEDPSCQARCKWDYCQAQPCRQLVAISTDEVVSAAVSLLNGATSDSI